MNVKSELKGRIIAMYGTIAKFADHIGMSYRKVSYIISGRQEATASDIEKMSSALNIEIPEELHSIFFA